MSQVLKREGPVATVMDELRDFNQMYQAARLRLVVKLLNRVYQDAQLQLVNLLVGEACALLVTFCNAFCALVHLSSRRRRRRDRPQILDEVMRDSLQDCELALHSTTFSTLSKIPL